MSFANLQQNRGSALAGLQKQVEAKANADAGNGGVKDPRFWKLSYNKDTLLGSATIRFLPYGAGVRLPWAEWIEFSFNGKGGKYWNRSLKSIGKDDPITEINHLQWERNGAGDRDACKTRTRRLRYISNIVVVNDPAHPENNGKNFLFEYGPAIHLKIMAAMVPEYEDQTPTPVYDLWAGANFKIRTKNKADYLNYDDSTFDTAGVLHADESVLERFYNGMIPLEEFEDESNYKSYEELNELAKKSLGAHLVAGLRGETVDIAGAAAQGANPFAAQGSGGFAQQAASNQQAAPAAGNVDPFAQQAAPAAGNVDPFAQQAAPAAGNVDPFAQQAAPAAGNVDPFAQQAAPAAGNVDPFAGSTGGAGQDDPFANINL